AEDTFWARKLMAIDDSMIAAAVHSGGYSDPAAERYLADTLIKRRNAILKAYLPKLNPVVNPTLDAAGVIVFENVAAGLVRAGSTFYQTWWYRFDNAAGTSSPIGESATTTVARIQAPGILPNATDSFVRVDIRSLNPAYPVWANPVRVYFRRTNEGWKLTGMDRSPNADLIAVLSGSKRNERGGNK